jgi:DNA-binding transcriptional MocR family regulator
MRDYRAVADAVAAEIASGKLSPGMRLPPQAGSMPNWRAAASSLARSAAAPS